MRENAAHDSPPASHAPDEPAALRTSAAAAPAAAGKVRIIGGRWRGTRLDVADAPGLRPTSDRVRETLFNWLQPMLPGARVLDLFAGSGALGLEALSRGASSAVLVEREPKLAAALRATTARLQGGDAASVVQADAMAWLHAPARRRASTSPSSIRRSTPTSGAACCRRWCRSCPRDALALRRGAARCRFHPAAGMGAASRRPDPRGALRAVPAAIRRTPLLHWRDPAGDATDANHERTISE